MSRRLTGLIAVTSVVTLVAAGCGAKTSDSSSASSGASGGTIHIGAPLSLTGSLAREGLLTKQGYQYCQKVINAKGGVSIGGASYQLDIQYQDDTSKPDLAAQLVDQFNDGGVKLILGPYGSASTASAAPIVERNKQVMADSAGADDKIFTKGYKRTFAVLSPATRYAASIVDSVVELAKPTPKTVVVLSADDGFSKTAAKGAADEAGKKGLTVLATEYFPNGTTNVSDALTRVKDLHADLFIGSVHLQEGVAIMKQSKELGIEPSGGFGESVAPPTPDFIAALGPRAENVLGSTQWVPEVKGSDQFFGSAQDYSKGFTQEFGVAPEYHAAEATAACLAFALALNKAGATNPDKVRDAMAGLDSQSFFGRIKFDATGQNTFKPMDVIQIQGGKPVTVWPKDAAAKAMIWPGLKA